MKHLNKHETISAICIGMTLSYLVLAPLMADVILAQSLGFNYPVISHYPRKLAYRDKPLNVVAHVGADTGIQKVTIKVTYGDKSIDGKMPERKTGGVVPVVVVALKDMDIFSGPGSQYKKIGLVRQGEQVNVTGVRDGTYRIQTSNQIHGYINEEGTGPILTGHSYGVSLPVSMTKFSNLSYQIFATDMAGQTASTDVVQVSLMTPEKIAALRSGKKVPGSQETSTGGKSGFGKVFPWVFLAATGGATIYFLTRKKDKDQDVTVDVAVQWD
ncbi:SH3 domain-containing protein [candidate division KSB1 bacterium]|nr:SH3 domain-containing protein [candidate division KSB1 bacterium]